MKRKKSNKKKLKDKLWELTSGYVRRSRADHVGYVSCVTCGMTKHWKEMQAGHFIPQAQGDAVRFDLRNIHPQCHRCNINLGGNGAEYYPFMLSEYGQEVIDELRKKSRTTVKFTESDYEEMIRDIKQKLEEVDNG